MASPAGSDPSAGTSGAGDGANGGAFSLGELRAAMDQEPVAREQWEAAQPSYTSTSRSHTTAVRESAGEGVKGN